MNFAKLATGLIGAAFGLRTLDDSKPVWARIAYGAVAFDLISSAVKNEHPPLLGKAEAKVESAKAPLNFKKTRVRTIQERVAKVHEQLIQGTHDPAVYALAREVLTKKCGDDWCVPQKDHRAEVTALFDEVKKRVRYTWDPVAYDAFQTPRKTLALKAGDCDDYVSLLGALCRSVGIKVRSRIVQTQGEPTWNHIYLVAQMDDGSWMSLDPTILGKGAGYEVPDHIVLRKQDFDVVENGAGPQLDTP